MGSVKNLMFKRECSGELALPAISNGHDALLSTMVKMEESCSLLADELEMEILNSAKFGSASADLNCDEWSVDEGSVRFEGVKSISTGWNVFFRVSATGSVLEDHAFTPDTIHLIVRVEHSYDCKDKKVVLRAFVEKAEADWEDFKK